jgi:hypothetical protein
MPAALATADKAAWRTSWLEISRHPSWMDPAVSSSLCPKRAGDTHIGETSHEAAMRQRRQPVTPLRTIGHWSDNRAQPPINAYGSISGLLASADMARPRAGRFRCG